MVTENLSRIFSPEETSAQLGVTVATLSKWRCTGFVRLPFVKVGHRVGYTAEAIDRFIRERTHDTTSQYVPARGKKRGRKPVKKFAEA